MRLKHLAIAGFRNIEAAGIEPGTCFNLFYGQNAQGKTNLLEAIYLLGSPRSFRHSRLPELIRHGGHIAQVQGDVQYGGILSRIRLTLEAAGRRVEIDGKGIQRASDLHGRLNAVVFSPEDTGMVRQGPDTRRRYLDRAVYMGDINYLHCWHGYHRILKQRNHLLKSTDKSGLDIWTGQLAEAGAEVIERRQRYVTLLDGMLRQHYGMISGNAESAGIGYFPEGVRSTDREIIREELMELFLRHGSSDERYGTTSAGPHRDDLIFFLDDRPLKAYGSQGQQKSFVLALKMAEMENLHRIFGEPPILLLDDMSSELDASRNRNLMGFLSSREIQVFITTTERSPALKGAEGNCAVFRVEGGNLTFEGNDLL
ncbi:MAG: DNA replication/repair protein RecF [Deltaproteobacteria bacterium]